MEGARGDYRRIVGCDFLGYVSRHGWVVGTGSKVDMVVVEVAKLGAGLQARL